MLAAQIEDRTQDFHQIVDRQTVSGEAPLLPIVALEQQVTESLTAWIEQQDHQDIAERFRQIGQIGFRHSVRTAGGVSLGSSVKSIGARNTSASVSEFVAPSKSRAPVSIS
jgi:hypothetical protein